MINLKRFDKEYVMRLRGVVPSEYPEQVLRRIYRDIYENGLSKDAIDAYDKNNNWFIHLRYVDAVWNLLNFLPNQFKVGQPADPQIVTQFPSPDGQQPLWSHVDEEPPWANIKKYTNIIGFPLTAQTIENGAVVIQPGDSKKYALTASPGDIITMSPGIPHATGVNKTGSVRAIVYFRYLK